MKKMLSIVIGLCTSVLTMANSTTTVTLNHHHHKTVQNTPITFIEAGIEFAIFNDGQFDFNVLDPIYGAHINTRYIDFSFNTGHDYDTYVQYDRYGAVIQIENTPINYDYYGRVRRIGNIYLDYNNRFGLVSRVGNLFLDYNRTGVLISHRGFINRFNRDRIVKRRCNAYRAPRANCRIVAQTPYRRDFTPRRCNYDNYRRNYVNRTRNRNRYNNNQRGSRHDFNSRPNYRIAPRVTNAPNRNLRSMKNHTEIRDRKVGSTVRTTTKTVRNNPRNSGKSTTRVTQKTVIKKTPKVTPRTSPRTTHRDAVVVTNTQRTFRTR